MKRKGFGVEDTPFMILASVAVIMMVVWIGISAMATFVEGNEHQAAARAASDIYKRARLVSLGYDGSSDRLTVSIPEGYAVLLDGEVAAAGELRFVNDTLTNSTLLTDPMGIRGVEIEGDESMMPSGTHDVLLVYSAEDGKVELSWQ